MIAQFFPKSSLAANQGLRRWGPVNKPMSPEVGHSAFVLHHNSSWRRRRSGPPSSSHDRLCFSSLRSYPTIPDACLSKCQSTAWHWSAMCQRCRPPALQRLKGSSYESFPISCRSRATSPCSAATAIMIDACVKPTRGTRLGFRLASLCCSGSPQSEIWTCSQTFGQQLAAELNRLLRALPHISLPFSPELSMRIGVSLIGPRIK
jgi:hypothetical protein